MRSDSLPAGVMPIARPHRLARKVVRRLSSVTRFDMTLVPTEKE